MDGKEQKPPAENRSVDRGFWAKASGGWKKPEWLPLATAWLVIVLAATLLFIRYPARFSQSEGRLPGDFEVYVKARDRVWSGQNPYQAREASPYKYPPGFLVSMKLLPQNHRDAWPVFGMVSLLLWATALVWGARYSSWKSVGLLAAGIVISWKGILETLDYGQVEFLIFGISVASAALFRKTRFISGLLAGTLPWIKLPWLALSVPFILTVSRQGSRRLAQWVAGYFTACFLWAAAIPSLAFGPDRALELSKSWMELVKTQPDGLFSSPINQSLWSTLYRWTGDTLIGTGIGAVIAAWLLARLMRKPAPSNAEAAESEGGALAWVSPWLIYAQLLNPLSWRWASVFLVGLPLATLRRDRWILKPALRNLTWAVVVALLLLQQNPVVEALGLSHWTDLHPYGLVTVYWLASLLLCL